MKTVNFLRVTTCVKPDANVLMYVENIRNDLQQYNIQYQLTERKKRTIKSLFTNSTTPILIIQKNGIYLYISPDEKISYQESTMNIKFKEYKKSGVLPPLVQMIAEDENCTQRIADCTMGLGNDLMLMALTLPHAQFTAFEQNFYIHFSIKWSMHYYCNHINRDLKQAFDRIQFQYGTVVQSNTVYDIYYVDCLYQNTIETSNINHLVKFVNNDEQNDDVLLDYVTSKYGKVVLRAEYNSPIIKDYGFIMSVRRNTVTHYGYLINKQH